MPIIQWMAISRTHKPSNSRKIRYQLLMAESMSERIRKRPSLLGWCPLPKCHFSHLVQQKRQPVKDLRFSKITPRLLYSMEAWLTKMAAVLTRIKLHIFKIITLISRISKKVLVDAKALLEMLPQLIRILTLQLNTSLLSSKRTIQLTWHSSLQIKVSMLKEQISKLRCRIITETTAIKPVHLSSSTRIITINLV